MIDHPVPVPDPTADAPASGATPDSALSDPAGAPGSGQRVLWASAALLLGVALLAVLVGWQGGHRAQTTTASAGQPRTSSLGQAAAGNPHHLPSMPAGRLAPAFQLPQLGGGGPVSSGAFAGTPLVVNFFASWCPNCIDEMKTFASVSAQAQGRVAFVGVDSNDPDQSAARTIRAQAGVRYPVGVDSSADTAVAYWVVALPTTVFIDRHGRLLGEAFGIQSTSQLQAWIHRLEATN